MDEDVIRRSDDKITSKTNDITSKIRFWGIVQGVGFRPYVAKIADDMNMRGTVANVGGLVEVTVTDKEKKILEFADRLQSEKPAPSEIVHVKIEGVPYQDFSEFKIIESSSGQREVTMIPPDLAVCKDCLSDMRDAGNRRYMHPFISCMACGPRYSIIDRIPYDRDNTSMIDFEMCGDCNSEYTSISDRRYHAQTISCHDCGPMMSAKFRADVIKGDTPGRVMGTAYDDENPAEPAYVFMEEEGREENKLLKFAAELLSAGEVIAFKSMGGYNLIADPFCEKAATALRKIKGREEKPFAMMFKDVQQIREYCIADEVEEKLLTSSSRPIVLLERRQAEKMKEKHEYIEELLKNRFLGSFLPSMGAQYILLEEFAGPLIVTSANLSSLPIIKEDEEMLRLMDEKKEIAATLYNDRKIRVSVDDSVCRSVDGQPQMIRRSKGWAPLPVYASGIEGEVMAFGGQLKNSFALSKDGFIYPSQFFGDMDTVENQKLYEENADRMMSLLKIEPGLLVCDMHPGYFTTALAEKTAKKAGLRLVKVQHHHAHIASVMAENSIKGEVIGVSFDGTGYGTDGAVWGGEVLLCEGAEFERMAHLRYIKMPGGDESMKEAWKAATAHIYAEEERRKNAGDSLPKDKEHAAHETDELGEGKIKDSGEKTFSGESGAHDGCSEIEIYLDDIIEYAKKHDVFKSRETDIIKKSIKAGINTITSSSMGRLFDAVSAMLGICDYNKYEGQCAMLLEDAAARAIGGSKCEADVLALRFHERVADAVLEQCIRVRNERGVNQVALSGGVFQNGILMEKTLEALRTNGFEPYYNISVSPNDGGIALGQAYIGALSK